jgi:hypothetical protein
MSRYTRKCRLIEACKKDVTFPKQICTKFGNSQTCFIQISCTELHENWTMTVTSLIFRKFTHLTDSCRHLVCHIESKYDEKYIKYFNTHPTRCNVTQFILSGNSSTCFGWYHHPSSGPKQLYIRWRTPSKAHSNQFQLFHDSGRLQ